MEKTRLSSPADGIPADGLAAYRLRSDVRYRLVDGEALVLRQSQAEVLGLDEVGSRILELACQQKPIPELIATLAAEYEVEPQQLEHDVLTFLGELVDQGILEPLAPQP